MAQRQFDIFYLGAGVSIGTVEVGLRSQNLAGVIILVTNTGTGRGLCQEVTAAADWRLSRTIISIISIITITPISMGAELAGLHTAAVRTVILPCDPATASGVVRGCADTPTHVVSWAQ